MKLAIVNQTASVGGWRYLYMLVKNIVKIRPDYDVTIFVTNTDGVEEVQKLQNIGVKIKRINNIEQVLRPFHPKTKFHIGWLDKLNNKLRYKKWQRKKRMITVNRNNLDTLNDYDAVFYSWPYGVIAPDINKPLFFIPHDFIVSHCFGLDGAGFYPKDYWLNTILPQLKTFVDRGAVPIVSTDFIRDEYNRVFPESDEKPNVVFLSKFNEYKPMTKAEINKVLQKHGITGDYILFANNNMPHKNLAQTIAAMYYVKQKHPNVKLVISGYQNQNILCKITTPYYADHTDDEKNWDIKGIGLLPDDEFSALMQGATMCINASLCEAGAGSGIDAWSIGTPMVMSDIPAFRNQLDFLGVRAELFEPREARDIARAINKLLDNPELAKQNAKISKQAMNKYSWDIVAQKYIDVFENHLYTKPKCKKMKILFDFSFDGFVSSQEGICVYNSFLFQALLENYPNVELEIYTNEINVPNLHKSMSAYYNKFKHRIHIITPTQTTRKPWRHINLTKYAFCGIKQNLYKLLYKLTHNKHYRARINKWRDKKYALKMYVRPLSELIAESNADVAFNDIVGLTGTHKFKGPKLFMLHDLFTIPFMDLFRDLIPDIDNVNKKAIENLNKYADEGTCFVTATPYIRDEHVLKYISNVAECHVINYPPMLRDYSGVRLMSEKDVRKKFGIKGPYTFYASQNRPNKNVMLMLKALKLLKDKGVDFTLVTTGRIDTLKATKEYVEKNNLADRIVETGSLSEQDLYALYKYSAAAVVTTIIEGPGMPQQVLEPLTIGNIPVICSKCLGADSSMRIFGLDPDKVDLNWVDLDDDKGLAEKIQEVLKNPKPHIAKQKHIIDAYKKRTWDDVAHDYMKLFKQITKQKN